MTTDRRSRLPSVDRVLADPSLRAVSARWSRRAVLGAVRQEIDRARREVQKGKEPADAAAIAASTAARLVALDRPGPRRTINATGVVVHTNLGRACLAPEAAERLAEVAAHYSDLEFDVPTGKRGSRQVHVSPWLELLFPGRGVLAVNNNAAAVMLALNTLALGKGVAISRGELVEIGGSFRVPEILERSGARLVEVGTTNRTHLSDYEAVAGTDASLILKVWPSNYRVIGFTKSVSTRELAGVAKRAGIPLIADQGCGRLFRDSPGPASELSVEELLDDGVDLVCFSGDKMLGGPQAGILVGHPDLVKACAKNPLARALRLGKLTLAALSLTCRMWLSGDSETDGPPVGRMLSAGVDEMDAKARKLVDTLAGAGSDASGSVSLRIVDGASRVGGGAAPEESIPSRLVEVTAAAVSEETLLRRLRAHDPPVIARIQDGRVVFDPRTLADEEHAIVAAALAGALSR